MTDPEEAAQFVEETGVDALAVAIGTSHGAYKFTRKPDGDVLYMSRIEEIHARLPQLPLGDAWKLFGAAGTAGCY